jgi:hypothetical protein
MLTKKIALIPALIAMSVAATSLAVFAGPSGGDNNGGGYGGGDGKNGNDGGDGGKNGGDGGGDGGKNGGDDGGDGGKNGGDGGGGGGGGANQGGGGEGDRCSAYRRTSVNRHCKRFARRHMRLYVRARMVPCMQGDAIVYDYGCGRRIVYVPRPAPVYYVQGPAAYADDDVVVRKSDRRLSKRQKLRMKRQRVVMADAGVYRDDGYGDGSGYSYGYAGMSRAARMQQERRMRRRMAAQYDYGYAGGYGYGGGYGDDGGYGYAQPQVHHRKKRRHAVPIDYGYGYDGTGMTIHYGPVVVKNGDY